jgi:RecA-family ATPase
MWACEDDHDELWRRQIYLARWCKAGLEEFDENLVIIPRQGLENTLVSTEFGKLLYTPLIAHIAEQVQDLKAEVVVIDNVGQTYGGGENDRHCVTAFLNALVGALPGRAIMLLAHPSRTAGSEFSGSSAWENVARTRLYLGAELPGVKPDPEVPQEENVRYLARRKANYSPKDWRRMTYSDGALTPDPLEAGGGMIANIQAAKAERVIIDGLQKLHAMGISALEGQRSPQYLPKLLIEYSMAEKFSKPDLASAMRRLMVDGKLTKGAVGKNANRSDKQGLVVAN